MTHFIPYIENINEFEKTHAGAQFDFLFSIVNSEILSKEVLALPRYKVINYHNSPLPKYAGLHATSWAILNGETQHAISWHQMGELIDAGDILKQPSFRIEDVDTTLSLNLKCYEQAIHSFRELVNELATNSVMPVKQDLSYRSYYGLKNKPAHLGFISWKQSAEHIDRLCRALTFGEYTHQLEVPKVIIGGEFFVVKSHKKLNISSGMKPGTIVALSHEYLQVATETNDFVLLELSDLNGTPYAIERLISMFQLTNKSQLDAIDREFIEKLSANLAIDPKTEKFWVNEFLKCAQEKNSFLSHLIALDETNNVDHAHVIHLPNELLTQLQNFSNKHQPLKNTLLTAFLIYLYRLNNYCNMSIEFTNPELKDFSSDSKGFFSNYVPLTTQFDPAATFMEALTSVSNDDTRRSENKTYAKDCVIRYPELKSCVSDIEVSISFFDSETISYSRNRKLNIYISDDCSHFYVHNNTNYKVQAESYAFFTNMHEHFLTLLADIVSHPNKKLFELLIIGSEERDDLLVTWNNTYSNYDYEKPLQYYFEEQVSKTPNKPAVVFEDKTISYKELNQKANQLAHYLRAQGVKRNHLVGISLNRSLEMVVCILGILKSGAAYLPLDPNYPDDRIAYMLADSKSNLLIIDNESTKKQPHGYLGTVIEISSVLSLIHLSTENPQINNEPSDLAYVIYTSGTTGKPKGVAIPQRALCNHMLWMKKEYAFQEHDVVLQKTPFSFDASVWEFFMPLLVGGELIIAPNDAHASPTQMIRLIRNHKVSILQLVPSMLKELVFTQEFGACTSLKHIFCGGEALLPQTIDAFFKHNCSAAKLHNLYGPTEAAIDTTALTCTTRDALSDVSRIGKPIMNAKVYVLDTQMQPVPVGIIGELYIAGDGLAHGYLNSPEFTAQKFVPNPFSNNKKDRLYKTGDLVKWDSNGVIEYHGRCDSQVKIRGFRIEVNEIESYLEKISSILQCIVKPEHNADDSLSLSAYLVLENNAQISAEDICFLLKKNIPDYMIPTRFFVVEKLLTTPSGKVDRAILPTPLRQLSSNTHYAVPDNDIEKLVQTIWCSVLKIEDIGTHDDFFELGGNSLAAMNIISLIQDNFGITLSLRTLFDFPTIHAVALELGRESQWITECLSHHDLQHIIVPLKTSGEKPPLFLVHPLGGSVFWYKLLGRYIDKDRPLYGIQDPGLDKNELLFANLEEMASAYIDSIQAIQPNGPYLLGGASFGSTVSIEMARQLQERGETVTSIISFDGWAVYPSLQNNEAYFHEVMNEQNSRLLTKYVEHNVSNSKFLLELQWHREKMLVEYKMPVITAQFILFKAKKLTEMFQYDAALNWWENYSSQQIELHLVPGDHESIFYEPNIKVLVRKLNERLMENNSASYELDEVSGDSVFIESQ